MFVNILIFYLQVQTIMLQQDVTENALKQEVQVQHKKSPDEFVKFIKVSSVAICFHLFNCRLFSLTGH